MTMNNEEKKGLEIIEEDAFEDDTINEKWLNLYEENQ